MIVFFTAEYVEIKLQDNATFTQPLDQKTTKTVCRTEWILASPSDKLPSLRILVVAVDLS